MSETVIAELRESGLHARVRHGAGALEVLLEGSADMRAREVLSDLLTRVHAEAQSLAAPTVDVDLRGLEFMNSSCIKSFVTWLANLQDLAPEQQYKIRFVSRPELLWQRRSLHALQCFAADLVTITS